LKASILTGAFLFSNNSVFTQDSIAFADSIRQTDSVLLVKNDSTLVEAVSLDTNFTENETADKKVMDDSLRVKKIRSPKIAGLYSAIIPGLGQAYNHKFWKIPLIYIGGGLLIYDCIWYNDMYNESLDLYNKEYFKPADKQDTELREYYKSARDFYRKKRDRLLLYTGLLYAANIVDAIVDAYFSEFDISDDLSLKVQPAITYPEYAMGNLSFGMSIRLKF
jgi:hypothetical protein